MVETPSPGKGKRLTKMIVVCIWERMFICKVTFRAAASEAGSGLKQNTPRKAQPDQESTKEIGEKSYGFNNECVFCDNNDLASVSYAIIHQPVLTLNKVVWEQAVA
jgi:hypothetical protein